MCNARGGQSTSDSAGPQLRSVSDTFLAVFRSTASYERGRWWSLGSPSHWVGRSTNLCKWARAIREVQLLDFTAQIERGSVKPPQQLLVEEVLSWESDGVHTHTRYSLWASPGNMALSPSSLTSVSSTYGKEYLGALEKSGTEHACDI